MTMKRIGGVALGVVCCLTAFVFATEVSATRMKPLRVSDDGHLLVEEGGDPFFVMADTAWPLFSDLSRGDVMFYLDDRKAKGFNTILSTLLYSDPNNSTEAPPRHSVYGFPAFERDGYDLSRPNKEYWNHVDWVMQQAEERSLRLAIVPCRFPHSNVWTQPLTGALQTSFGEYLGIRTANYNNIIWIFGGDYPEDRDKHALRLMAEGIRYYAPQHLISYYTDDDSSSGTFGHNERWLALNSICTDGSQNPAEYALVRQDWHRAPAKPTWLAESHYEQPGGRFEVRQAAWCALLNGSVGFGYGASNMFNGDGDGNWKNMLNMPGAGDVLRMLDLLKSQPWHKLVPDHAAKYPLLTSADAEPGVHFPAACSADGDFAVIYLPLKTAIEVDMGKFRGPVVGKWLSPTTLTSVGVDGSPFANSGVRMLRPPQSSELSDSDLVLVLSAAAAAGAPAGPSTVLGIDAGMFTINGKRAFLFGISYYGALGSQPQFILEDLDDMQKLGINWIRLWATWG
ncbi:MAG: DUF4038 domain-containing protein, partial [Sedimentisphaerales bacterium]|nr:DUF4038 domain-containing protein [Sedimentisphaerales bacterium]